MCITKTAFRTASLLLVYLTTHNHVGVCGDIVRKEDLDLPYNATGNGEEEEEAPEIAVLFGVTIQADVIVFVLEYSVFVDKDPGWLSKATQEVLKVVKTLSESTKVALILYNDRIVVTPDSKTPEACSEAFKQKLTQFLSLKSPDNGSILKEPLLEGIRMAKKGEAARRRVVLIGQCHDLADPGYRYTETLEAVHSENQDGGVIIDAIYACTIPSAEQFCRDLAKQNGGQSKSICSHN